jgi:hypothetical protein
VPGNLAAVEREERRRSAQGLMKDGTKQRASAPRQPWTAGLNGRELDRSTIRFAEDDEGGGPADEEVRGSIAVDVPCRCARR